MVSNDFPKLKKFKLQNYFSIRNQNKDNKPDELNFLRTFNIIFLDFDRCGYFAQSLGYRCVDQGIVEGNLGPEPFLELSITSSLGRIDSIYSSVENANLSQALDLIEFFYEIVSKPVDGEYHSWSNCGWHFNLFDIDLGKMEWLEKVNNAFIFFNLSFRLNKDGRIYNFENEELDYLMTVELKTEDDLIRDKYLNAIKKFRIRSIDFSSRRDAIKDLADILEYLKPQMSDVLTKSDHNDLFQIVNNFGIRHFNSRQKLNYDEKIWLSWMFHYYLATINAIFLMIEKRKS